MATIAKPEAQNGTTRRGPALQPHPLAERIPLPTEDEYIRLRDDMAENGQHLAIVRYEGRILDGRTRYRACGELGVEPLMRDFDADTEGSPLAFVISMNYNRRDLSEAQKRTIRADNVADLRAEGMTNEAVARVLGISEPTVRRDQERTSEGRRSRLIRPSGGKSPGQEANPRPNRHADDSESAGQTPETPRVIVSKRGDKRPAQYTRQKPKPKPVEPRTRRLVRGTHGEVAETESTEAESPQPEGRSARQNSLAAADHELVKSVHEAVTKHQKEAGLRETIVWAEGETQTYEGDLDYLMEVHEHTVGKAAVAGSDGQTMALSAPNAAVWAKG